MCASKRRELVLEHVRIVDGTGRPPVDDENVIVEGGKIAAIQPAPTPSCRRDRIVNLHGYTSCRASWACTTISSTSPARTKTAGGMDEPPLLVPQMTFSAPRLYLAGGVTTLRTTGSVETYSDLNLKRAIDEGKLVGPHLDVTGPYLEEPTLLHPDAST